MAIIFVGLVVFLALFVALLIPLLAREVPQFAAALPGYLADLQRRDDWLGNAFRHANVSAEVRQFIADLPSKIGESFTAIVAPRGRRSAASSTSSPSASSASTSWSRCRAGPRRIAKLDRRAHVNLLLQRSFDKIGGYVSGNLITSAVCAAATVVALLALRFDYAVPLGLWAGVAHLIPPVGAYLGALPAVLVALTEGPASGVATVLFFIAYQQSVNYLLAPRVYKSSIDLSPAAVIISTLAGGILAGFAGALLALPIAAAIKVIAVDVVLASRSNHHPRTPPTTAQRRRTTAEGQLPDRQGQPPDPKAWLRAAESHEGSWWPDYDAWLAERCGVLVDAPARLGGEGLHPPGTYVFEPEPTDGRDRCGDDQPVRRQGLRQDRRSADPAADGGRSLSRGRPRRYGGDP